MAQEWTSVCVGCGAPFRFSHSTFRRLELLGEPLPVTCPRCEIEFSRERRAIGRPVGELPAELRTGPLEHLAVGTMGEGVVPTAAGVWTDPIVEQERAKFGVSDERLVEFYNKLDRPEVQVVLVEAPTGAGKSTFFPFRLLSPPPEMPDPEVFTRNGQIVVTQPRIQATVGIPTYVRKLHGSSLGAGFDVGYRCSKAQAADWNCKLVYLTDGTLINWIAGGLLANISLIMLDEAHERSMNIDLIIGLLTKMLPRFPWLKLVIASATIDSKKFMDFFARHLPGGTRCESVVFEGKPGMPVRKHFRCGHVEWEDKSGNTIVGDQEPAGEILPYDETDLKPLLDGLAINVATKAVEILERMHPSDESRERGVPDDLTDRQGDVLGFLLGEDTIMTAVGEVKRLVKQNPVLKERVQVLPFFSGLPLEEQQKVIEVGKKPPEGITTVIMATNAAETSLTLTGVKHVVETGLINRDYWDTPSETSSVQKVIHSQAGCRQRWGRAGRVADGDAWTLYSKAQFDLFPRDTDPAIIRTRLETVILTAKYAGVDRLDGDAFPWLDPPPPEELDRALRRLRQHGALDDDGDLTAHGIEIQKMGGEPELASRLIMADRFALAVEMATVLPLIAASGSGKILMYNRDWDRATKRQVAKLHAALASGCRDDLELVLKIFASWREARRGGDAITGNWAWREIWQQHREAIKPPAEARVTLSDTLSQLETRLAEIRRLDEFDELEEFIQGDAGLLFDWLHKQRAAFQTAASETWAKLWFVDHSVLANAEVARDDRIDKLAVRKREKERRNINFEALDRLRALIAWASPDSCFIKTDETRGDDPVYAKLSDRLEQNKEDKDASDSFIESDEADEDERFATPVLLKIDGNSVCHKQEPEALISLSFRRKTSQPHPNAEPREFVSSQFNVLIDRQLAEAVASLDAAGLAMLFAKQLPPEPLPDDSDRFEGPVRQRLFLDQRFPVFSQFTYELKEDLGDGRWLIELAAPVAFWPDSRKIEPVLTVKDKEEEEEEEDFVHANLTEDDYRELYGDGEVELDPQSDFEPEPLPESDPADEEDDVEGAEKSKKEDSQAEPPKEAATGDGEVEVPELEIPKWPPVRVELRQTQPTMPAEPIAEVVAYASDESGEPTLVLETPTPELSYELFKKRHRIGDVVVMEVVGLRSAGFKQVTKLLVREPESGLELEIGERDLAFVFVPELMETLQEGDKIDFQVTGFVDREFLVSVSRLPLVERLQQQLFESQAWRFSAHGPLSSMGHNFVRFAINAAPLLGIDDRQPVYVAAELRVFGHSKLPLRCQIGRESNIAIEFCKYTTTKLPKFDGRESVVEALSAQWGKCLEWDEEKDRIKYANNFRDERAWKWEFLTHERYQQALQLSNDAGYQDAIERLYRQANKLGASVKYPDLAARYPVGMLVRGRVLELGEAPVAGQGRYGTVRLDCGITSRVDASEFREGHRHVAGSLVTATVLAARPDVQQIDVTLQPPEQAGGVIRMSLVQEIAERRGLLRGNYTLLKELHDEARSQLERDLEQSQQEYPWFAWARLRIAPRLTGWLLGTAHATRKEIEQQFDVRLFADDGDVFLLAASGQALEECLEHVELLVERGKRDQGYYEETERLTVRPPLGGASDSRDMYASVRQAPVKHVAQMTRSQLSKPSSTLAQVKERLGRLGGLIDALRKKVTGRAE